MCSAFNPSECVHTPGAVGSQCCGARGAVEGSVPCSMVSPQSWYWSSLFTPPQWILDPPHRQFLPEPRFEPITLDYKCDALSIRPRLPHVFFPPVVFPSRNDFLLVIYTQKYYEWCQLCIQVMSFMCVCVLKPCQFCSFIGAVAQVEHEKYFPSAKLAEPECQLCAHMLKKYRKHSGIKRLQGNYLVLADLGSCQVSWKMLKLIHSFLVCQSPVLTTVFKICLNCGLK